MNQRERAVAEDLAGQQVIVAARRAEFARRVDRARRTEAEIRRGIEAAADSGHSIMFTAYRTISSLFESATPIEDLSSYNSTAVHSWATDELLDGGRVRKGTGVATLSSFCPVDGALRHLSLDVRPRQAVVDKISQHMLLSDQYVINFEVVVRGRTSLVTAKYNHICGSRWLAIVHTDSIPGIEK